MFKKNTYLIFILLIIIGTLISAFIIEYWLGHQPCKLCIYERIPYFISLALVLKLLFFKKYEKITFLILSLIFLTSSLLSFYHFGIEQGFFDESFICDIQQSNNLSKEDLLKELNNNVLSCKDVSFKILGLSLAAINIILSFILSLVFFNLFNNYGSNSTSQYR